MYVLWCQSLDREVAISAVPDLDLVAPFTRAFRRSFLVPIVARAALETDAAQFLYPVITTSEWRSSFAESEVGFVSRVRYAPHNRASLLS